MSKKIYDIKPPKIAKKIENTIKEFSSPVVSSKKEKKSLINNSTIKKETKRKRTLFTKRNILIAFAALVLVVGIYLYNSLQKATIEISPVMQNLSFQEKITADKSVKSIDTSFKVIPADYIEMEKDGQQEFPSTGTSSTDSKATGSITIYNKYNPATSVTLLKGSHFLSDSGKYFVTLDKVTIPAAKYQSGKLVSGLITVKVQAEAVGPDYNIGPSKFSIPKLSGTAYYYSIWAESNQKMVGGSTGKVKKVTKDDIDSAKESLTNKLFDDAKNSIKSSLSKDDILFDDSISKTVITSSSSDQANSTVDSFNETAKVKVSALVFKKSDLNEFVKNDISSKLKEGEQFLLESLKIDYSSEAVDLQKGTEIIDLTMSYKIYHSIDQDSLLDSFRGRSSSEIKDIIDKSYAGSISEVKVSLWPFWVTKAPNDKNKIKIKLNFN